MNLLFVLIPLIAGGLQALQGVVNSAGSRLVGIYEMILGLSLVQAAPPLIAILFRKPVSTISQAFFQGYQWYLVSGAIGIIVIAVVSLSISKVGVLPVFSLVILGQIVGSTILDQIGLFGCPKVPITPLRVASVLFIVLGVILLFTTGIPKNFSSS